MKKILVLRMTIFALLLSSCSDSSPLKIISMSPGTLGSSATIDLKCDESDVEQSLDCLINGPFAPLDKDSLAIDWWRDSGYDFLNYRCFQVKRNLYMLTIRNEGEFSASVSIRAYYSYKKKKWIFATAFKHKDEKKAEYVLNYIVSQFPYCETGRNNRNKLENI